MKIIYKYRMWNDHTKEGLKGNTVYCNTVESFNDPFDMFPSYPTTNEMVTKLEKCVREKFWHKYAGCKISEIAPALLKKFLLAEDRKRNTKYGVACFAEFENNILMWSHYAKDHTGVCIGYEMDEDFLDESGMQHKLIKVQYDNQRPSFNPYSENSFEMTEQIITTKFKVWQYENEYRVLMNHQPGKKFPRAVKYKRKKLNSLRIGANAPLCTVKDIIEFCRNNDLRIDIYYMYLDDFKYELKERLITDKEGKIFVENVEELRRMYEDKIIPNNLDILYTNLNRITINELHLFENGNLFIKDFCKKFSSDCSLQVSEKDQLDMKLLQKFIEKWCK